MRKYQWGYCFHFPRGLVVIILPSPRKTPAELSDCQVTLAPTTPKLWMGGLFASLTGNERVCYRNLTMR